MTNAHAAIADGISDGVWDDRDRVTLGTQVARFGPDDAARAIAPLFLAINAQRVPRPPGVATAARPAGPPGQRAHAASS